MVNIRGSNSVSTVRVNNTPLNTSVMIASNTDFLSAGLAKDWAIKENETVDGVDYSSKYYAQQAKNSEALTRQYMNSVSEVIAAGIHPATNESLGGVVVGANLDVDSAGVVSVSETLLNTVSNKVSKSGDTMTGDLTLQRNYEGTNFPIKIQDTNLVKGIAPEENHYSSVRYIDSNGNDLGGLQHRYLTDGSMALSLTIPSLTQANTSNGIYAISNPDGTFTVQVPTPPSGDNSTKIATTAFVNTDFLPKSGGTVSWLNVNGSLQRQGAGNPLITVKGTTYAYTDIPSEGLGVGGFQVVDKNGEWVAIYGTEFYPDGRNLAKMQVKSKNGTSARAQIWADSNNTFHFSFPMCTTKATTTSSARSDLVATVVQNYVNGTSWYRVWSDGWIEQGGQCTCGDTVTFLKAFSNTNYTPIATRRDTSGHNFPICIQSRTTTKMAVSAAGDTGSWGASWYACGY